MSIFLYDGNDKVVSGIGKCNIEDLIIDSRCYWKKNDYFYIELDIIKDDEKKYKRIKELDIIKCKTPFSNNSLFRIKEIEKENNKITVKAKHIFYDLENRFIQDAFSEKKNGQAAIEHLLKACDETPLVTGTSDISLISSQRIVRKDACTAFISDEDNSFVNRYHAWLSFGNKFEFTLNKDLPNDRGFKIQYGKNITGYTADIDYNNMVTRIYPLAFDGIVCGHVDSPIINDYPTVFSACMEFNDYRLKEEGKEYTEEDLKEYHYYDDVETLKGDVLIEANKLFATGIDKPKCTFNVDLIALEDTVEYENIKTLVKLFPNDEVEVLIKDNDISVKQVFNEFEYNLITNKYTNVVLGAESEGFFSKNNSSNSDIVNEVLDKIPTVDLSGMATQGYIDGVKKDLEDLIHNGVANSYVVVKDNEILIMDTQDVNTCVNCIRINNGGIACSQSGYMGPYTAALGINGKLNIVEETCNKITANLIQGGIISDVNNTTNINLETGTFNFKDFIVWDGVTFSIKLNSGNTIETELNAINTTVNNRIDAVNKRIDDTLTDVDGAITDGVIQEAEKRIIENSINQLNNDKQAIFNEYTTLNKSPYLTGTAKTNLQTSYSKYSSVHNDLITCINTIITDNKVDDAEKQSYKTNCDKYKDAFADVKLKINEALQAIADKQAANVTSYVDTQIKTVNGNITTKITEVSGTVADVKKELNDYKTSTNKEIGDVNGKIDKLSNGIDKAIQDGVVTETEKVEIRSYLVELQREKTDIDSRYNAIYNNPKLIGTPKTNLKNAKDDFNTKHTTLVDLINTIITDNKVTEDEKTSFNTAINNYNASLSTLSKRFEEAIDAIGNTKISEIDKTYTEKFSTIEQSVDGIKTTVGNNTTSISNVDKSFNDYKTATDSKLSSMQSQINKFSDDVSGAISDNILTEAEVRMIKKGLDDLKTQKDTAYATYLEIYNNKYLDANVKTNLKNAWDTYESKYNTLVQTINNLISDENIDDSERTVYNTAMSNYQSSYASLETQIQKALDNISTKKISKSEETLRSEMSVIDQKADNILIKVESNTKSISNSNKALEDYKTSTNSKLNSMQNQINKFSTDVGAAISDNILTEAEIKIIKNDLNDLKTQKDVIYESYYTVYTNTILDTSYKTSLGGAWSSYESAYNTLVNTINNLIADENITDDERKTYQSAIRSYQNKYAELERQIQRSLDNISTKKVNALESDVNSKISTIDQKADSISIKVEEVDKKTATNANNINNLTTRVSTAESKITPNAIINTVKNSTDSNGNKTFVTNSELAQYSDKFVYSFGNSNGYNLVQNGSFNGTTKGWRINNSIATLNDFSTTTTSECNLTRFGKIRNNNASQVFIYSNRFALEAGQKYTFSFYGKQSNLKSMSVKLYYYNSGLTTSNVTTCNTAGATGSLTLMSNKSDLTSSWKRYYATFSTSTSMKSAFLVFEHNGYKDGVTSGSCDLDLTGVMIYKGVISDSNGRVQVLPFSYSENEIYNSSTIIDGTGLSVYNGDINIYKGNSDGSSKVFYGDSGGNLHITGQLESCSMKSGSISSTDGDLYFDLNNSYVSIKNDGNKVGRIMKNNFINTTQYGITMDAEYGYYTCLGNKTSSNSSTYSVMLTTWGADKTVNNTLYKQGTNLHYPMWCHKQNINDCGAIVWTANGGKVEATDTASIFATHSGAQSYLCLKIEDDDDDYICMSCYRSSTNEHKRLADFAHNGNHMYRPLDMHWWEIKNTNIVNASSVSAYNLYYESEPVSAYSLATYDEDTDTYSESNITKTYTQVAKSTQDITTEIGSTKVNEETKVYLPTGCIYEDYFVQLTPIGKHECWLEAKYDDYFVIKTDETKEFTVDYMITMKAPEKNIATDLMSGSTGYTLRYTPTCEDREDSEPLKS